MNLISNRLKTSGIDLAHACIGQSEHSTAAALHGQRRQTTHREHAEASAHCHALCDTARQAQTSEGSRTGTEGNRIETLRA